MSHVGIRHDSRIVEAVVSTAASAASAVRLDDAAAGIIHIAGVTVTHTLTVLGSSDGVTFAAVYGSDGQTATVAVPATGGAIALPDAVYPLRFVKFTTDTDMGTAVSVAVSIKS